MEGKRCFEHLCDGGCASIVEVEVGEVEHFLRAFFDDFLDEVVFVFLCLSFEETGFGRIRHAGGRVR